MIELASLLAEKRFNSTAKSLIILDALGGRATTPEIVDFGVKHGLRGIKQWGVSDLLRKAKGRVAHPPEGWVLLPPGEKYLAGLGYVKPAGSNNVGGDAAVAVPKPAEDPLKAKKVFLVHGRNDGAKHEVARFVEKLGIEVVILHERPNKGRTLVTKFEEESAEVAFAIVLMTADDEGGLLGGVATARARQNVVFEFGFFIGALGAPNVAALVDPSVEQPSDLDGLVYIERDAAGAWKSKLAQELRAAGINFDASKMLAA
ncbi:nucleotide-binding protein [Brevundimonas sp.]|uniref:nucleotide-binding protein n=1 Tax=Brevundimonas sp. TaxID=1871086 RepID=UPI002FC7D390